MAQLKAVLSSLVPWHHKAANPDGVSDGTGSFHAKFQAAFESGKFAKTIEKAEIDYAEGRALDRIY